ncbi:MAG: hypothetical protein WCP98_16030, partial [Actinomycetes bacterium]
ERLDLVVLAGESGAGRRPPQPDWLRAMLDGREWNDESPRVVVPGATPVQGASFTTSAIAWIRATTWLSALHR